MKQLIKDEWLSFRTRILTGVFCVCAMSTGAQNTPVNLVPNGGFEIYDGCPTSLSQVWKCEGWNSQFGSADFYHGCGLGNVGAPENIFGYQVPNDSGYIGLIGWTSSFPGGQEVAFSEIISPLQSGAKYRIRFKASYADSANYAICCIGAILSSTSPPMGPYTQNLSSVELILDENEFDTETWFQYEGVYTAQGGEDKIYVGTFRPEDDMNLSIVRPNGGSTYDKAYFYIDDISVIEDTVTGIEENEVDGLSVTVYPNPSMGDLQIQILGGETEARYKLSVRNPLGAHVYDQPLNVGLNEVQLPLASGSYLYSINSTGGETVDQGRVVIVEE